VGTDSSVEDSQQKERLQLTLFSLKKSQWICGEMHLECKAPSAGGSVALPEPSISCLASPAK
jgi:hypothetical protein